MHFQGGLPAPLSLYICVRECVCGTDTCASSWPSSRRTHAFRISWPTISVLLLPLIVVAFCGHVNYSPCLHFPSLSLLLCKIFLSALCMPAHKPRRRSALLFSPDKLSQHLIFIWFRWSFRSPYLSSHLSLGCSLECVIFYGVNLTMIGQTERKRERMLHCQGESLLRQMSRQQKPITITLWKWPRE